MRSMEAALGPGEEPSYLFDHLAAFAAIHAK